MGRFWKSRGRGEYRISHDAPAHGMRFNISLVSERNPRDKWSPPSSHWPKTRPHQNGAGRCGPIEHVRTQNNRENKNVPFDRISPTPILNAISKESAPRTSRARHSLPTSSDFYVTASLTKYVWLDRSLPVSQGMSLAKEMTSWGVKADWLERCLLRFSNAILYQIMCLPMSPLPC